MSPAERFESASGLRPASAFVVIAAVLGFVALRGAKMALADEGSQPDAAGTSVQELPDFEIHDRHGVPLALSVDRLGLVMSPNAMWQAHTPDYMARRLSEALGGVPDADELLRRMLPDAHRAGGTPEVVDVEAFVLDPSQAMRVQAWLDSGDPLAFESPKGHGETLRPVRGMWLERIAGAGRYRLRWRPVVLLSEAVREEQGIDRPQAWSRAIADALVTCIEGEPPRRIARDAEALEGLRSDIWHALMPSRFKVVLGEVPAEVALNLSGLFEAEWVHSHQMKLRRDLTRRYPVRGVPGGDLDRVAPAGRVEAPPAPGHGDARTAFDEAPPFEILGRWGTADETLARRDERARLGLAADEPCPPELVEELEQRVHDRVWSPHPKEGLELLCARTLERPEWDFIERDAGTYDFLATQVVRRPQRRYFREVKPASEVPALRTTLDATLQRMLRGVLQGVMETHDPALAMAIVVDVAGGEVLAVDSLDAYGVSGFQPVLHSFTPGSTFKVVTMAAALEAGAVRPGDVFDTFDGGFAAGGHRIREALGAPVGRITASEAIVGSSNAVMAQIGMRIEDDVFHATLAALGYGRRPSAGLGGERPGLLPGLPWKLDWTHASISFGHEVGVTFWQHTAALATIVRGGEFRPLRLLESIEQDHVLHRVVPAEPVRVLSSETCAQVRAMMREGALSGTGAKVARDDIVMGTKTGTAQKVADEVCLHVELDHQARHRPCTKECRRSLKGVRVHGQSCYTSSMVTFGRLPGEERELLVFVVVDEPRGRAKFGADVAGSAAVEILARALELPARLRASEQPADGFVAYGDERAGAPADTSAGRRLDASSNPPAEQPWAERDDDFFAEGNW